MEEDERGWTRPRAREGGVGGVYRRLTQTVRKMRGGGRGEFKRGVRGERRGCGHRNKQFLKNWINPTPAVRNDFSIAKYANPAHIINLFRRICIVLRISCLLPLRIPLRTTLGFQFLLLLLFSFLIFFIEFSFFAALSFHRSCPVCLSCPPLRICLS